MRAERHRIAHIRYATVYADLHAESYMQLFLIILYILKENNN
jgi:hypothetical protein